MIYIIAHKRTEATDWAFAQGLDRADYRIWTHVSQMYGVKLKRTDRMYLISIPEGTLEKAEMEIIEQMKEQARVLEKTRSTT